MRLLAELARLPVEPARLDAAERLGGWLGALDTVRLEAALQVVKGMPGAEPGQGAGVPSLADVQEVVRRGRADLQQTVRDAVAAEAANPPVAPWRGGAARAQGERGAQGTARPTYAPYHKRHADLQRRMDLKVGQLRGGVRRAFSKGPLALRQLAALDAALEQALAGRSERLLASVPVLLERRFESLVAAQPPAATQPEEGCEGGGQPAAWLQAFHREWQEVLLAELDVRLQPVLGLMEALSAEVGKVQ